MTELKPARDQSISGGVTLEAVARIAEQSDRIIDQLQKLAKANTDEEQNKTRLPKGYTISEVARRLNRTTEGIRKAEKQGRLIPPPMKDNGRRSAYTLTQINAMRDYWECRPGRQEGDSPVRFAFQNFKGGVGKTTLSAHCAQYFAQEGYRVLLIDCDSQGSSTMTFGYQPDSEITAESTLLPFLSREAQDLRYAIRSTHWAGLDLIPANLELYSAEYYLAANGRDGEGDWISLLDTGIATVESDYDLVIVDPPPALGMISLCVLRSVDGLIVPTPPAMYDFHSSGSFFHMLEEVLESVGQSLGEPVELDFVKILVSKAIAGRQAHDFVTELMAESYGHHLLQNRFLQSAEVDNASSEWRTVYDLEGPTSSRQTYLRCLQNLDAIFGEVRTLVEAVWQGRRSERTLSSGAPSRQRPLKLQEAV